MTRDPPTRTRIAQYACAILVAIAFTANVQAVQHATEEEFARVLDEDQEPSHRASGLEAPDEIIEAFEQLDGDAVLRLSVELLDLRDVTQARDLWVGLLLSEQPDRYDAPDAWAHWEWAYLQARRADLLTSACRGAPAHARALDVVELALFGDYWTDGANGFDIPRLADALASPQRRSFWRGLDWTVKGHQEAALRLLARAASDPNLAPRVHFAMGRTLVRLNRFEEALAELDAAGDAPEWFGGDCERNGMSEVAAWHGLVLDRVRRAQAAHAPVAVDDPFGYLWTRKSAFADGSNGVRALAALGRRDLAMVDLARLEQGCGPLDWERDCAELPDVRAELGPDADAPRDAVPVWIAAPLIVPFEVKPVPPRWRTPLSADEDRERERLVVPAALAGEYILHVATDGMRMLAVSSAVRDGVAGEWLHLSRDGGEHFDPPLFLGEAMHFPHALVVRPSSRVPPFDGDILQVEVERLHRSAGDYYSSDDGPARRRDLFLRIDVGALRRDSDGDGLTDMVEESLLLDPTNDDTDGDGMPDAVDSSPRAPRTERPSVGARILLATLFGQRIELSRRPTKEIIRISDEATDVAASSTSKQLQRTPFVVGAPANEVTPPPGSLWIGITDAEWASAAAKFGPRTHANVRLLVDENQTRCVLHVSDVGGGDETLLGHREGSDWILDSRGVLIFDYMRPPAPSLPPRRMPR